MWKAFLPTVKATFPVIAGMIATCLAVKATAQQNIIANKDNTRPEIRRQYTNTTNINPAVTSMNVSKFNGYNEIAWTTLSDEQTRNFIVEYSINGTDYLQAGLVSPGGGAYSIKHYTNETRPLLYRVKAEQSNGLFLYTDEKMFEGITPNPVRLQTNSISGNIVQAHASVEVERINVYSPDGTQVYAKDVNGQKDLIRTRLPDLAKGMYFISFYGAGWKDTQKIVVL